MASPDLITASVLNLLVGNLAADMVSVSSIKLRTLFSDPKRKALEKAIEAGIRAFLDTLPPIEEEEATFYRDLLQSFLSEPLVHAELSKLLRGHLPDQAILVELLYELGYDPATMPIDFQKGLYAFVYTFQETALLEPALADIYRTTQLQRISASLATLQEGLDSQQESIVQVGGIVSSHHRSFTEIRSGPVQVIASGTVISYLGNPIEITFGPLEQRLNLVFNFSDDEKGRRVQGDLLESNRVQLTLFNFNDPLGAGSNRPIPVGAIDGRDVSIQYRVYAGEYGDKTIHYTLYINDEANNE